MITVEIDTLTPCLINNKTGEIVETEAIEIKRKSFLSKYNVTTGWYVNWVDLLIENQVYALVIKGTVSIQGLIAVRNDSDMKSAFITWMVAAPNNNKQIVHEKEYNGVGGHLFAIAAHLSYLYGYDCAISGFAATRELMEHYCNTFNAEPICMLHEYQIFIPEVEGQRIKEVYTYDWTDECL